MGMESALALGALGGMLMSRGQRPPQINMPAPPEPPPPPQAARTPDTASALSQVAGMGQAGGSPGPAQNFLTGPGGVAPGRLSTIRPLNQQQRRVL